MPRFASRHEGLLGTTVHLRVDLADGLGGTDAAVAELAREVEAAVLAEFGRAAAVFSAFDPGSELCRWRDGRVDAPGDELASLLRLATHWQVRSDGVFNPAVGAISERWAQAERDGVAPTDDELADLASSIAPPGLHHPALTLNAIAKGHLVDLGARAAMAFDGVEAVLVNAGGDLVHRGSGRIRVGVDDPLRRLDNAPPVAVLSLADAAVATSGSARRGFTVAGRRVSHVIDPRTGRPVDHVASATVVAPDAATADVLATVLGVLAPGDGQEFVAKLGDEVPGVAALVIDAEGRHWPCGAWARHAASG